MEELINRVSERTNLGEFLVEVVDQLKITDTKQFDRNDVKSNLFYNN